MLNCWRVIRALTRLPRARRFFAKGKNRAASTSPVEGEEAPAGAVGLDGRAPFVGRTQAHDLVYDACREALARNVSLLDVLDVDGRVRQHLQTAEITRLCDPANYLGVAPEMVDRVVARQSTADENGKSRTSRRKRST